VNGPTLNTSSLHHAIIRHFVDRGCAPTVDRLSTAFAQPRNVVVSRLHDLQEDHGVVLHPTSSEVWVAHPFASAPTNFWVRGARGGWWANCAWCALGVAALVSMDVSVTTVLGGEHEQVTLAITSGRLADDRFVVHFPVPMRSAWDNVIFTCSTMLLFASAAAVDEWSRRHQLPRGDVRPVALVWELARVWYGRHLDADWKKWTAAEARAIFDRFGLAGPIWDIPPVDDRF
jgi:hypothetical protein